MKNLFLVGILVSLVGCSSMMVTRSSCHSHCNKNGQCPIKKENCYPLCKEHCKNSCQI